MKYVVELSVSQAQELHEAQSRVLEARADLNAAEGYLTGMLAALVRGSDVPLNRIVGMEVDVALCEIQVDVREEEP